MAHTLLAAGVTPGERVGVLAGRSAAAVLAVHAVPRAGAVVVPLHEQWSEAEIAACVEALGIRRVVVEDDARSLPRPVETVAVGFPPPQEHAAGPALPSPRDPADEHSVLWTSGTTGTPRGVSLSALNHMASAIAVAERLDLRAGDHWALTLQPAHVGGLALILRAAATGGVIVTPAAPAPRLVALVDARIVSHLALVPVQFRRLLEARGDTPPPANLRVVLVGGDALDDDTLARALALGYPVALTYGLTEATSQVATAPPALVRRKPGTVGPPLDGVTVRIAKDDEILVRGATVMRGYVGTGAAAPLRDGWLCTGDLGRLDDEGHLRVIGRKTARIVTGGVNVDPREIERVLEAHPAVAAAAVVGVPDAEWGETVGALVVSRDPGGAVPIATLTRYVADRLAPAKRPRRLLVVDALPHTVNQKIDVRAARRLLADAPRLDA